MRLRLHVPSLMLAALVGMAGISAAQTQPIGTASACASCHRAQTLSQPQTLNASLAALFISRASPERREARASPGALTFVSRDDLCE